LNCFSISSSFNFFTYIIFGLILFIAIFFVLYPYLDLFYFSISSLVILFYLVFISYLVLIFLLLFFIIIFLIYFLILSLIVLFHLIFILDLVLILLIAMCICFFFYFGWLRILLHDFFEFVFYGVTRVICFEN
jgi:hypothetical protein